MKTNNKTFTKTLISVIGMIYLLGIIPGWAGQSLADAGLVEGQMQFLIQGLIFTGLVIPGVLFIRKYGGLSFDLGLSNGSTSIRQFLKGAGLLVIPIIVILTIVQWMGWAEIIFHADVNFIQPLLIGFFAVLLHEAIPEELLVRGLLYGVLRTRLGKWTSALLTVIVFVLWPVVVVNIQHYLLGMTINVGGADSIQAGYMITMFIFGCFTIFLRIFSGSVWMGVGFHCLFVYINKLFSPTDASLIQISEVTNTTAIQITAISCYVLIIVYMAIRSYLNRRNQSVSTQTAV
ncbi:CPBP family intramembrane glutamic endopeptidase [Fulvivirga sedimenti]|uniref:CPBP family intramembrane metalloprotease n=1 Tax=Fulvivirga sedimenti TaxID=2879465 RepID=A0A9X1HVZ6_9BACT|nr:CPBP family intramembrane glutamic endopeptidase [Fulvivirga sedimenti]MCA6078945.1 CPBP family intramembrane metalloprotease [Fulvivirga sedimenti]